MTETEYTPHLLAALNAPNSLCKLWRQNAGTVLKRDRRGKTRGAIHGAPAGAADLTGIVTADGWRIEVELKGQRTRWSADQKRWCAMVQRYGGIYVLCRINEAMTLGDNIAAHIVEVHAAITARRPPDTARAFWRAMEETNERS